MKIVETMECTRDVRADPRRRCRIKAAAVALGSVMLALTILLGGLPAATGMDKASHAGAIPTEASIR